jgi:site-specific recombinase XerD
MTPLRARFIAHLHLKGYAAKTQKNYLQPIIQFSQWLKRSPDTLTREELQRYLLHLKLERKLAIRSLNIHIYALKCFCDFVLPEADIMAPYRRLREPEYIPEVLSRQEIKAMIDTEENLKYKAIIALLYSGGLRLEECVNLNVSDIDSSRMVVNIHQGKGAKDRITLLSQSALDILRQYWIQYKPQECLFEGNVSGKRIHRRTVEEIVAVAGFKTGLRRRIKTHTLRHSFATHLHEDGVSLQVIQHLLGHERIDTTCMYTKVSTAFLSNVKSPLDVSAPEQPSADPLVVPVKRPRGRPRKNPTDKNAKAAASATGSGKKRGRKPGKKGGRK